MNYYFFTFLIGVIITFLICKNFYILRENQNAHIFSKMFQTTFRNIVYRHETKKGDKLFCAIHEELLPCLDFLRTHEDFLPNNMKKWFQKAMEKWDRSHDYLNRYTTIKIDKDSADPNLLCHGEKSFQYVSLVDLVMNLLYAQNNYTWAKLFYPRFDTS